MKDRTIATVLVLGAEDGVEQGVHLACFCPPPPASVRRAHTVRAEQQTGG